MDVGKGINKNKQFSNSLGNQIVLVAVDIFCDQSKCSWTASGS
jgi:hypothetical protein